MSYLRQGKIESKRAAVKGQQELVEPDQTPEDSLVETNPLGGQDVAEVSLVCQDVPDTTQTCYNILEKIRQPSQEVPDISQLFLKNHNTKSSTSAMAEGQPTVPESL
ncbi:hypothetical protein ACRRTK_001230 [Alexandromys fortis]